MSIYRHFGLPPITGKLQSFTTGKRSVNGKSRAVVSTGATGTVAPELFEELLNKNLGFMGY